MKLQQLSLFLENRPGRLGAPQETIAKEGINILTLSLADTAQFGILRLIVRDMGQGQARPGGRGLGGQPHRGGGGRRARSAGRTGRGARRAGRRRTEYRIHVCLLGAARRGDKAILIFRFENPDRAIAVLLEKGLHVVDGDELLSVVSC